MNNLSRLKMEIPETQLPDEQLSIYLQEQSLDPVTEYVPADPDNNIAILSAALAVLESFSNNVNLMKNYKSDDISVSSFSDNIQNRITQLDSKIRKLSTNRRQSSQSSIQYLFGNY